MIIFYYSEWSPPGQARVISVTGCNHSQVVCAAGPILFHLEVKDGQLVQNGDTTLEYEVACIGKIYSPKNVDLVHSKYWLFFGGVFYLCQNYQ